MLIFIDHKNQTLRLLPVSCSYDYVYGTEHNTGDLYETAVAPLLEKALDGFHCTIFAYGQTGASPPEATESESSLLNGPCRLLAALRAFKNPLSSVPHALQAPARRSP